MRYVHMGIASICLLPACASLASTAVPEAVALEKVTVTARRRPEILREVPMSISVLSADRLAQSGIFSLQQATQLVPSLYYSSANPRNTAYTIRGLGSNTLSISAANDGIEPGVGFHVDDVYQGRPAIASFDFVDVERVEVMRGPQGTLFGKNSTAGAVHVIPRLPTFENAASGEISFGGFGYRQMKLIANASTDEIFAARLSAQLTRRDGVLRNLRDDRRLNALDSRVARLQLRLRPEPSLDLRLVADLSNQQSRCCTQGFLRVGQSQRNATRQFPSLAARLGYVPPSTNVFERISDIDGPLDIDTRSGGVALHLIGDMRPGTLTAVTAWRYWDWDVANDRDYLGIPIQTVQRIPSRQEQLSGEMRFANGSGERTRYVTGLYHFSQSVRGRPTSVYGPAATVWLLNPASFAATLPDDLLDGYGQSGDTLFRLRSIAAFAEVDVQLSDRLVATLGARYTHEDKYGTYDTRTFGGADLGRYAPAIAAELDRARLSVLRPQSYSAAVRSGNSSGRASVGYRFGADVFAYATVARGYKSGGINMSGLPLDGFERPASGTAVIGDEINTALETGVKWAGLDGLIAASVAAYRTRVTDYQANVVSSTETAALRSYPSNIPEVIVGGIETDVVVKPFASLVLRASVARSNGRYARYPEGPCPLELQTGALRPCNLGGQRLAGLSDWVGTLGIDYRIALADGEFLLSADMLGRSGYNGDTAASRYTWIPGHRLVNLGLAYRPKANWEVELFARNLFDAHYLTAITIQSGNSGLILGQPGDPRLVGVTVRAGIP
jgi:iron complex outermembrane receptor protein